MPRKKELTFEQHLELAKKIQIIRDNVTDVLITCENHFNRNNPIVYNAMALMHSKHFSKLQSLLDDEYCKISTDKELRERGFIYYRSIEELNNKFPSQKN